MIGKVRFDKLLEPYHIGKVQTRNRIVKTAAGMSYQTDDYMNEISKAFYEGLAKGGVGLLMVESPAIDYPLSLMFPIQFRLDDDRFIPGFSELTEVIHKHGCPTFLQMWHCGQWQQKELFGLQGVAASAISRGTLGGSHLPMEVPRELSIPEIEELVNKFASTAVRAQKAGFDGVEVNASSNHLLATFLSRIWNRRQDTYGGSLENRARFVLEIIREIKKRLGQDFPVCVTINGVEDGRIAGITEGEFVSSEHSVGTARILQEAGADAIQVRSQWLGYHVAGFFPEALFFPEPPIPFNSFPKNYDYSRWGAGAHVPLGAAMKEVVDIPLIAVGRLDAELGEKFLREGKADLIAINRRLLADPEFPNKIASGSLGDIAPCTACHTCLEPSEIKRCRINAALGTDEPYVIKPAEKRKSILVVGGGPAGMEAARVAALRGHEVTLLEKTSQLGGLIPVAALVKGLEIEDLPALVDYLKRQITKLGVKVRLGKEADVSIIEEVKPDVVILATGGIPMLPEIPGISRRNVISNAELHRKLKLYLKLFRPGLLGWLTKLWMPVGKRVVIIGGGKHGCELAEFLVKRGRKVTITDTADALGEGMFHHLKCALLAWFQKKDVTMITGVKYVEITDKGLTVINKEGNRQTLEADSIIPAMSLIPDNALLELFKGKAPEIHTIGDCREPLMIVDAIADGSRIARAI